MLTAHWLQFFWPLWSSSFLHKHVNGANTMYATTPSGTRSRPPMPAVVSHMNARTRLVLLVTVLLAAKAVRAVRAVVRAANDDERHEHDHVRNDVHVAS